jgi:hypothetical protein
MHAFVEVIPFLLHLSLFLFFGGLIAFLQPVNPILVYLICGVLGAFITVYFTLTVLPLIALDSPYKNPLSTAL